MRSFTAPHRTATLHARIETNYQYLHEMWVELMPSFHGKTIFLISSRFEYDDDDINNISAKE